MSFKTFADFMEFSKQIDESRIDRLYKKAHVAVQIVQKYDDEYYKPKYKISLFENVSTIAELGSGVYGVYIPRENKKILSSMAQQKLIYRGRLNKQNIDLIPKMTLLKSFPDIRPEEVQETDTIHINVMRIMKESGSDLEAIREMCSTIVHESTHALGFKDEPHAYAAEGEFTRWFDGKVNALMVQFKDLQGDTVGKKGELKYP